MPLRFDRHEIGKPTVDQSGYLHVDALVTRSGVFVYHHPDGTTTRELRHPDEVGKADSITSLENRPVTDGHPYPGKLDAKNTKQFSIGSLVEKPEYNPEGFIKTKLMVTDQAAIDKIMKEDSPKREVSCGYECKTIPGSGIYQGEHYDHVQKDIIYNHVAIVDKGRAGPSARLVLDAADGAVEGFDIELKQDSNSTKTGEPGMKVKIKRDSLKTKTFKTDALSVEVDESAEQAIGVVLDARDLAVDHIKGLETKLDDATTKADTLQGEIDQLKKDAVIPPEKLAGMVAERADVLGVAAHIGITAKLDAVDSEGIKKMIVAHKNPDLKMDESTPAGYIQGRYDSIIVGIKADNEGLASLASLKAATTSVDNNGVVIKKDDDELSPREQFSQKSDSMWQSEQDKAANAS